MEPFEFWANHPLQTDPHFSKTVNYPRCGGGTPLFNLYLVKLLKKLWSSSEQANM